MTVAYRRKVGRASRRLFPFSLVSAVGGILGNLFLNTDEERSERSSRSDPSATVLFQDRPRIARLGEGMASRPMLRARDWFVDHSADGESDNLRQLVFHT